MSLFGLSLVGLRLFSVIAQAAAIVLTGLMAHELGGRRLAQVTAALAVALSPLPLFEGTEFQYSSFDYLWWVLIAYFTVRLLEDGESALVAGHRRRRGRGPAHQVFDCLLHRRHLGGVVLSQARRFLVSGWFWGGIALALADLSAQLPLAGAARLHLLPVSPTHPCARRGRRPRRWLSAGPVQDLHQPRCRAACSCGVDRFSARARATGCWPGCT